MSSKHDAATESEDRLFVTPTGTVYHGKRDCVALKRASSVTSRPRRFGEWSPRTPCSHCVAEGEGEDTEAGR